MTEYNKKIKEIKSEEDLQNHFHDIHNFIRNRFGFYGKAALQFFNFFFVLKLIEPLIKDKCFKDVEYDICSFTKLNELVSTESGKKKLIDRLRDIKLQIYNNDYLKEHIFMNFPTEEINLKDDTINDWFNLINVLDQNVLNKFHAQGRLYEYFLGFVTAKNKGKRQGSQIEDLGQFFTSRTIIRYIIAKLDPELDENKNVPSMCDSFCGSGGFIIEYIKYINHKYKDINWNKNIQNLYGLDTDRDIVKSALVDIMLLTNTLNEKQIKKYNKNDDSAIIQRIDSTFEADSNNKPKVMFNITNPPYGGGKMNITNLCDNIKHIQYSGSINIKVDKKSKLLLKGNDKEAYSLMHGMGILEKDGIYAGVLKEGVFFDKKYSSIREALINNYEVLYVISVPQDDFLNTTTKTSILIFKNSGKKTTNIKFCELEIIKNKDDNVVGIKEINSGTKKIINEFYCEDYKWINKEGDYLIVNIDDIIKNNYSFNVKNYIKDNLKVNKGFKIVKLGDICKLKYGERITKADNIEGEYPCYGGGDISFYTNKYNREGTTIVISRFGMSKKCVRVICGKIFLNDSALSIHNDNKMIETFLANYLTINQEQVFSCGKVTAQKNLDIDNFKNIQIPIPEDINTIKLYLDVLEPSNEALQALQALQALKEKQICNTIKLLINMGVKDVDYDEYNFNDLIEYQKKNKKYKAADGKEKGKYKFYTSSQDKIMFIDDEPMFTDNCLILGRKGNACVHYDKMFSCEHDDVYVLKVKDNQYRYLYYYIQSSINWFEEQMNGSTIKGTSKEILSKFIVKILKPEIIKKYGLDKDFEFVENLKTNINTTLQTQKEALENLMKLVMNIGINKENKEQSKTFKLKKFKYDDYTDDETQSESEEDDNEEIIKSKTKNISNNIKKIKKIDKK